jgi:hypothetical protein
MLDAMVQLLTGSNEGFDNIFYEDLRACMISFDDELSNVQVVSP